MVVTMPSRRTRLIAAASAAFLGSLLRPGPAATQQLRLSGLGLLAQPRVTVRVPSPGTVETVEGPWYGGRVELGFGRLTVVAGGLRGDLRPADSASTVERAAGEVEFAGRLGVFPWLQLEAGYTVRAYSSDFGYQKWIVRRAGLILSGALGDPALRGYAAVALLPGVSVRGQPRPERAVAVEVGISVYPRRVPLGLELSYRAERYDFPGPAGGGSEARLEQFDRLLLAVGVHVSGPK